jgi:hypothetical protein
LVHTSCKFDKPTKNKQQIQTTNTNIKTKPTKKQMQKTKMKTNQKKSTIDSNTKFSNYTPKAMSKTNFNSKSNKKVQYDHSIAYENENNVHTFFPTSQQFESFDSFLRLIHKQLMLDGVVRVQSPPEYVPNKVTKIKYQKQIHIEVYPRSTNKPICILKFLLILFLYSVWI